MKVIATDLDRTLLPNGDEEEEQGVREHFAQTIKDNDITLIYVTGRNLPLVVQAIDEFKILLPNYLLANLGTEIYQVKNGEFIKDQEWEDYLDKAWKGTSVQNIKEWLAEVDGLRVQEDEKNNAHKQSYYFPYEHNQDKLHEQVQNIIDEKGLAAEVITSIDQHSKVGLLDVVPTAATKIAALHHLAEKIGIDYENLIFAGDSGNDLLPLTSGLHAVLVANARQDIKDRVKKIAGEKGLLEKIYFAKATKDSNGNYASGILQGAAHFGLIRKR